MGDSPAVVNSSGSKIGRHSLADWLELHELDVDTCRCVLNAIPQAASGSIAGKPPSLGYVAPDVEAAWFRVAEAMRHLLPEQRSIIDDTLENTVKLVIDKGDKTRALTLDKGAAAYPVVIFSYNGQPGDLLVIAHEFAHALQIRASQGRLVPPVVREICAFLGERALLFDVLHANLEQHAYLAMAWQTSNRKYLGTDKTRFEADLIQVDAPYSYSWNYPIARLLANSVFECRFQHSIWEVFEGKMSVRDLMRVVSTCSS